MMELAPTLIAWLGTGLQIAGALGMASRWLKPHRCFVMMLPGALIWLVIAGSAENWPLAAMQLTFALINGLGLLRWMP